MVDEHCVSECCSTAHMDCWICCEKQTLFEVRFAYKKTFLNIFVEMWNRKMRRNAVKAVFC